MAQIVAVHSFRRGAGKSHITANVAALLAAAGRRVGVVDASLATPSLHLLFGVDDATAGCRLNDYLLGRCAITQAVYDVTTALGRPGAGRLVLVPAGSRAGETAQGASAGYPPARLYDGVQLLSEEWALDTLLIDTPAGLTEETLGLLAAADALALVLRLDQQDYQGTGITLGVARQLGVARVRLVVNQVAPEFDPAAVRAEVEQTYGCPVTAVLPHAEEMTLLASGGLFALHHPTHPLTAGLREIGAQLVG